MNRMAAWLREADESSNTGSIIIRCHVAAAIIDDLERRLRLTEKELIDAIQLNANLRESREPTLMNFFRKFRKRCP